MKKKLTDLDSNVLSSNLLQWHTIGSLRNEGDLSLTLYHGSQTIKFAQTILRDYKGTNKEKVAHLEKALEDLLLFHVAK
jgi:hypothetical protein